MSFELNSIKYDGLFSFVRFPPLSKLICVLKQFLLQRDLNEVIMGLFFYYGIL
jgi:hypothetical protein